MPLLLRKMNYRNIILDESNTESETVGVYRGSGELSYVRFLGFIERDYAAVMNGAKPVKLSVASYSERNSLPADWIPVPTGYAVQGCLLTKGVYGVVENGVPRVVIVSRI